VIRLPPPLGHCCCCCCYRRRRRHHHHHYHNHHHHHHHHRRDRVVRFSQNYLSKSSNGQTWPIVLKPFCAMAAG